MAGNDSRGRLVLSIDVGTAQSAVAIYYEHPRRGDGEKALVGNVDNWPGQQRAVHLERVPTAVLYDDNDQLIACGAEAISSPSTEQRTKYFKMDLNPNKQTFSLKPLNVSLMRVYTDFLEYLLQETRRYMRERFGHDPWSFMRDRVEIILTHPNGWGEDQQRFLQASAVNSGLITKERAQRNKGLFFIEEAEAATCYALSVHGELEGYLKKGFKFVVCDAGGSTIDISAYAVKSNEKNREGRVEIVLAELCAPSSLNAGGVHVDMRFREYLTRQVRTDPVLVRDWYDEEETLVEEGLKDFQAYGKRWFKSSSDVCKVDLGARRLNRGALGITKGEMTIQGRIADTFFTPSTLAIISEVNSIIKSNDVQSIILTGGFSDSPYFQRALRQSYQSTSRSVLVANPRDSKAVPIGALRLLVGRPGSITVSVERKARTRVMWLTNLKTGVRQMVGKTTTQR